MLGCTHYPLLKSALARYLGSGIRLVDSAENCALAVRELLAKHQIGALETAVGTLNVALTDASDGFLPVAEQALGLAVGDVALVQVQR